MSNESDRLIVSVSGVRGTVGGSLTAEVARQFGGAFAALLGESGTVVIGADTRPSGPMIRQSITEGLLAGGVSVIDLGIVTTPGAALMTTHLGADGGVVITASHNPGQYNGIKFLQPTGVCLTAAAASELKEIWSAGQFPTADVPGVASTNDDTHAVHVEKVCGICDTDAVSAGGFKVVVDSINGAGCVVTPMLLDRLGVELVHINAEPNGQFAHTPEPVAANLEQLCQAVRDSGADVGFAQDPDADRLAIVDETGRFLGEEYSLALTGAFRLGQQTGKVAANSVTSRMIDDIASADGCEVVRAPTGEANVVEAMLREGCFFGGEGNGGVIDPRVVPVRNSLVGMAMVLQYMAETGRTVGELAGRIQPYVMIKTKMPCPAGAVASVIDATRTAFAARDAAFDGTDGLRIDLPQGWVSVRGSNTEPIIRVMAEARDADDAKSLADEVRAIAADTIASQG